MRPSRYGGEPIDRRSNLIRLFHEKVAFDVMSGIACATPRVLHRFHDGLTLMSGDEKARTSPPFITSQWVKPTCSRSPVGTPGFEPGALRLQCLMRGCCDFSASFGRH